MTKATLLRIYTDESAYSGDRPLREVIFNRARDAQLAGVTISEALVGIGHSAHPHRQQFLQKDRPIIIEIVDAEDRLREFAQTLSDLSHIGMMTLIPLEIIASPKLTA